jgi:hypothetical protein
VAVVPWSAAPGALPAQWWSPAMASEPAAVLAVAWVGAPFRHVHGGRAGRYGRRVGPRRWRQCSARRVVRHAGPVRVVVAIVATMRFAPPRLRWHVVWHIGLVRRQRRPMGAWQRPARRADHHADRHTGVVVWRRWPRPIHQRRRKHRARRVSTRRPAPAATPVDPAPIVKRRKAPGLCVDPGPAPRPQPDPAAIAVRRPTQLHADGHPQRTMFRMAFPAAITVQVLRPCHLWRDIAR